MRFVTQILRRWAEGRESDTRKAMLRLRRGGGADMNYLNDPQPASEIRSQPAIDLNYQAPIVQR